LATSGRFFYDDLKAYPICRGSVWEHVHVPYPAEQDGGQVVPGTAREAAVSSEGVLSVFLDDDQPMTIRHC
jgi:hypothetical protein